MFTIEARYTVSSGRLGMPKRKRQSEIRQRKSDEPYDVGYFARKHDITPEQARELMRKLGRNRDKLNEAASRRFRK